MFDFGLYSTYLFKFFCIVCGNAQGDDVGAYLNILSLLDFRTLDPRPPLPPRGWGGGLNLLTPGGGGRFIWKMLGQFYKFWTQFIKIILR